MSLEAIPTDHPSYTETSTQWPLQLLLATFSKTSKTHLSPDEIGELQYQEACKNAPTAVEITKDDSEYGDSYWGKIDGRLTKLVFISEDESRSEAWFNGLRPTANFVDGDRLHIEA